MRHVVMVEGERKVRFSRRKNVKKGGRDSHLFGGKARVIIQTFSVPLSFIIQKSLFGGQN